MVMRSLQPTDGFTALRREIGRVFDRIWEADPAAIPGEWTTASNISGVSNQIVVEAEVPGIDPK